MRSPLKLTINRGIVVDQVAQFLIATKAVPYKTEIIDILFDRNLQDPTKMNLLVYTKPEELEVTYFDLDNHATSKSSERD